MKLNLLGGMPSCDFGESFTTPVAAWRLSGATPRLDSPVQFIVNHGEDRSSVLIPPVIQDGGCLQWLVLALL